MSRPYVVVSLVFDKFIMSKMFESDNWAGSFVSRISLQFVNAESKDEAKSIGHIELTGLTDDQILFTRAFEIPQHYINVIAQFARQP